MKKCPGPPRSKLGHCVFFALDSWAGLARDHRKFGTHAVEGHMKRALLVGLSLVAFSAVQASAADLPVKARPMAPVAVAYNWTGCYIGGNVGGKWIRTSGSATIGAS